MLSENVLRASSRVTRFQGLVIGVVLVVVAALGGLLGERACNAPVDISGTTRLPAWLVALKERDAFAYPAHRLVGTLLNAADCSPPAAGLQWIKAAAHARTEQEAEAAQQGLSSSRSRAASTAAFDTTLCAYVRRGFANARQATVVQAAGLTCEAAGLDPASRIVSRPSQVSARRTA